MEFGAIGFWDWMTANEAVLGKGPGLFCPLHFVLMGVFFALLVATWLLSKRFPRAMDRVCTILCAVMIVSRVFRMLFEILTGYKTIAEAMPFHLCHIMAFVIPISTFLRARKIYHCIMFYGFIGGLFTFLFGDYYKYSILTFYDVESIALHFMLACVAVSALVRGEIGLTVRNVWQIPFFLLLLACWAELGNTLLGTNFMFIRENGLPFRLFPGHFLWTYVFLLVLAVFCLYLPFIIRAAKARKARRSAAPSDATAEAAATIAPAEDKQPDDPAPAADEADTAATDVP